MWACLLIGGVEPSPGPCDKTEFEENKSDEDATSAFSCTQAVLDSLYSDQHDKNDGNYDQAETLQTDLGVWVVTWIGSMMWVNRSDNQSNQVVEKKPPQDYPIFVVDKIVIVEKKHKNVNHRAYGYEGRGWITKRSRTIIKRSRSRVEDGERVYLLLRCTDNLREKIMAFHCH